MVFSKKENDYHCNFLLNLGRLSISQLKLKGHKMLEDSHLFYVLFKCKFLNSSPYLQENYKEKRKGPGNSLYIIMPFKF